MYERKYGHVESKKMMLVIASKCARTYSRTMVAGGGPSRASVNGVHYIEVYCICADLCQYRAGTLVPSSIAVHASHKICRLPALFIFQPSHSQIYRRLHSALSRVQCLTGRSTSTTELTDNIQIMTTQVRNDSDASSGGSGPRNKQAADAIEMVATHSRQAQPSGPLELNEVNAYEKTGYAFSNKKKWAILTVVGLCQTSMSKWPCQPSSHTRLTGDRL